MFASQSKTKAAPAKPATPQARPAEPALNQTAQRIVFQKFSQSSSTDGHQAAAGGDPNEGIGVVAPFGVIVDDGMPLGPGQVSRTQFMTALSADIERVANEELAAVGRTAAECPYLKHWLEFYRNRSAAHVERAIQQYARPERFNLESLRAAVLTRVRTAVQAWVRSGGRDVQVPEGVAQLAANDRVPSPPSASNGGDVIQRMPVEASNGNPSSSLSAGNPAYVRAQLAPGRPLEGGVRTRMEHGLGHDLSDVRIHTDASAARLATAFSARAFTIGSDIAFGSDQFRPGTPRGDLMLAHELAHVVQQRGNGEQAQSWSTSNEEALELDADRAAISTVARSGIAPDELAEHIEVHPADTQNAGLRLQRCGDDDVDYSAAPAPPDYSTVVTELRALYAKKVELGRTDVIDETALEKVNEQIQIKLDELRLLGVMSDEFSVESKVTAPGGPQELRVAKPIITRSPAEGPMYVGRRIRFQLSTDWLPPDEIPHVEWRWKADGRDRALMYKEGLSCDLDRDYWGTKGPSPGTEDAGMWREAGGATFYAKIKLGEKAPVFSNEIYIPFDKRLPHEMEGFKFEIATDKAAIVVGENPNIHVKDFTVRTYQYWVEWTVEGEVINYHSGIGGGFVGQSFDSPGTKHISARLFLREDVDGKHPLTERAETTVDVQDPESAGRQTLARGEELGAYAPLSEYKKSHDSAMAAMGTRAKLGETGGAKEYWQKQLNAKAKQLKQLEEKVPDYQSTTNVAGADYGGGLAAAVSSTPIPTVIVYPSKREQVVQPVSVYLITRKSGDKWTASILDVTGKIYRFDGSERDTSIGAAASAFAAWRSGNEYPIGGKVVYTFNPPGWTFDKTFSTTSAWKIAEAFLDAIIAVGAYVAIGLLMLAPDATITKVLGVALIGAVAVRGGMAIKNNLDAGGKLLDKENIIEMVMIITSILGGAGTAARALGHAARGQILFRAGNWMLMTSLVGGGGTLVFASAEAIAALRQVLKDPTLTDSERSNQMLSIIASSVANFTMFAFSTRAMLRSGLKPSDFFKQAIPKKGAGPIEITEGTRIDLEVALRARGVKPEALKVMSSEALIDAYYEVTTTRPELVRIPDNLKGLKPPEIATQLGLPNPPAGYKWVENKGRLTVQKPKGAQKLVYDPQGEPGKQFIPEPKPVAPSKVQVARAKVVPADVESAANTALKARQAITNPPEGKTVARWKDGTSKTSGYGSDPKALDAVENLSAKIGHEPAPHDFDRGMPGSYNNSHAEKQLAALKPGEPIGVSRVMCIDCQIFFGKLANHTGKPIVVSDPAGVRVFLPNKPMITAPNAAALGPALAAASEEEETE